MFWPSSEYRYSIQSLAAFGCGAKALIAWTYMPPKRPDVGTTTSIAGLPLSLSLSASALYVQPRRIGVLPLATVAVLAMTGTKLPASLSFLKKSRPSLTLSRLPPLLERPAAQTADWAWFEASGSPNSATLFL